MADIHSFVTEQEAGFKRSILLEEGYDWNFADHVRRSFLYKNSQFTKDNSKRSRRPFKNIIRPILNIHYRTEGFDVKDIEIYVDNPETYYKSFLVKKYHDKWALKHAMDTFIDELVESYVDYGGVLVKNVKGVRPEVVDLRTLAFCDQTDILSGPFAIKHYFSPSQLRDMEKYGWGKTENGATISIESLVLLSEAHKRQDVMQESTTPGRYVEIYEVHNVSEMDIDLTAQDSDPMLYVVAKYTNSEGKEQGSILFKNKEPKLPFKFLARDTVQGRALGFGAIEELFEAQTWTNFGEIHSMGMLEQASKIFYKTNDPKFKNQNLTNSENGKVFDLQPNTDFNQIDNFPRNLVAFTNACEKWYEHARIMGAASEISLGQQPSAGTPFASLQEQIKQGNDLHLWRQGRIAVFVDEIYRDWVIPQLGKEIVKGTKFLSTLTSEEMRTIADTIMTNAANSMIKETILAGQIPDAGQMEGMKQMFTATFFKSNKKFIEILKDEMSDEKLDVSTNIAGKQKNLALITDKVVNIIRQFIATPEIRQDPEMIKLLNVILESSGLSPMIFSPQLSPLQPQGRGGSEPLEKFGQTTKEAVTV